MGEEEGEEDKKGRRGEWGWAPTQRA